MGQLLKVGIRPSLLAFKQAEEIQQQFSSVEMDIVLIKTSGDRDKTTPLSFRENFDFFTDEIERALLSGDIDVAIHSAKDLEANISEELIIVAITQSVSPHDCLISYENRTLDQLPSGSRVGTSSQAR